MDNTLGKEIWNYPIYSYKSNSARRGPRTVEVKTNIGYVNSVDEPHDVAPRRFKFMYFHYWLDLDLDGKVVGGGYYRDSSQVDLLWVPLAPAQGGREGNQQGNPYLNMKEVISLWRESCPAEDRAEWYNIDPLPEDAIQTPVETQEEATEEAGETISTETVTAETVAEEVLETADSEVILSSPR